MCNRLSFSFLWLAALALTACGRLHPVTPSAPVEDVPLFEPPAPPKLSLAGYQLILDFEVGGGQSYYDARLQRPNWPGHQSGVTVGVGYDCGYSTAGTIRTDWHALIARDRLAATAGIKGPAAKAQATALKDITVSWVHAEDVFQRVTLARFCDLTRRTFPGFDALHPNAQAALVSLVFNRGSSMVGPARQEMRAIRDRVPRRDYSGIAGDIRAMTRIWQGTAIERGMTRRREAEARLVETAL